MATNLLKPDLTKSKVQPLFSGDPIELTDTWQNLGQEINCKGVNTIALWVDVDINGSTDVSFQALTRLVSGGDAYEFPIKTISSSKVSIEDEDIELNVDADQKVVIEFSLNGIVPYVQFQTKDGNNSTGQIESAYITFKK